jgi:ABC-type branched-subunit amino acid transport system ATPase component
MDDLVPEPTVAPEVHQEPAPRPLLQADGLVKRFGGLFALNDVSIEASRGEVTGLIGPNGSGKSTLFDVMTGVVRKDGGRVWFGGQALDGANLHRCAQRGLVRTFQVPRVARSLTVLQHLMMARPRGEGEAVARLTSPVAARRVRADERDRLEGAEAVAETLGLAGVRNDLASSLSGGQLKLLTLGVALMTRPRMLLLDEPVAGVNPRMIEVVIGLLRDACTQGVGVVLIEHNMSVMWEICSNVYALDAGRVIAHDEPQALQHDPLVIDAYLGRSGP